jgi:hypothetical protein
MVVMCFWELTVRDSAAEVVLAIFTVVMMLAILGWASSKVVRIAQRSITMHKNPAYILYSDPTALNKWGFLYVQFKATAYYFIVPFLIYILVKGMFMGLSQGSGVAQSIALVLIEACFLIAISVLRPYMDKKTNGFNIAIAAVNFLSAIFILVFSNVFNQPVSFGRSKCYFKANTVRVLYPVSWVSFSSSTTQLSLSSFSLWFSFLQDSRSSPKTLIPGTSLCATIVAPSSSRKRSSRLSWTPWGQPLVVRARASTVDGKALMTTTNPSDLTP